MASMNRMVDLLT